MSKGLDNALEVERKAIRRYTAFRNMFFVYLVIVTLFTSIQTIAISQQVKDSLEASKAAAAENHKKTQDYVKCVAVTLLKPLAERQNVDFENCTVVEEQKSSSIIPEDTTASDIKNSIAGTTAPPMQAPQIEMRETKPDETTGAAPPDPDPVDPVPSTPAKNSRVLTIIDGILQEVDGRAGSTLNGLGL